MRILCSIDESDFKNKDSDETVMNKNNTFGGSRKVEVLTGLVNLCSNNNIDP